MKIYSKSYSKHISNGPVNEHIEKTLTSTKLTYFDDRNLYFFDNPLITSYTYTDKGMDVWHLKGQRGSMLLNDFQQSQ